MFNRIIGLDVGRGSAVLCCLNEFPDNIQKHYKQLIIDIHGEKRFLNLTQNDAITRLRELFHEKEQLQKLRSGLISQLRQRLSYEFPEAARHTMQISSVYGYTPIVYWLAFNHSNARYDNKYRLSIAPELGIKINIYTRKHAQIIIGLETRITKIMGLITENLAMPEFTAYSAVFDRFNFGLNIRALLLFNLYPFEKFLVEDKPWIEYERSQGKLQKRDRSLRKFQAFCGLSYSYKQSGDKVKRKFYGNSMIRSHLYAWSVCVLSRIKNIKQNKLTQELSDRYQELRQSVKGKDALTRILFKLTRMLFYELVKELAQKID